jgi:hypothetical protein
MGVLSLSVDVNKNKRTSSADNIAWTETATMMIHCTVVQIPAPDKVHGPLVHGPLEDVLPGVVPDKIPAVLTNIVTEALLQVTPSVPDAKTTQLPLASTQDTVQFVAVHSPATAKSSRKTRKPRRKAIQIASPTKSSPSKYSAAKYVFLDDPMKTIMLQLNQNHLAPLANNEFSWHTNN